jgi:hypothetical protein
MWRIKFLQSFRRRKIIGIAVLIVVAVFFSYPYVIAAVAERNKPEGWSKSLGALQLRDIHHVIGAPQVKFTAKDYEDWEVRHWWGGEILKVIYTDCCRMDARPATIQYIIYVKGRDMPIIRKYVYEDPALFEEDARRR